MLSLPSRQKARRLLSLLSLPWAKLLEAPKVLLPLPSLPGNEASGPQQEVTPGPERKGWDGLSHSRGLRVDLGEAEGSKARLRSTLRGPLETGGSHAGALLADSARKSFCALCWAEPLAQGAISALAQTPPAALREEGLPPPPKKPSPPPLGPFPTRDPQGPLLSWRWRVPPPSTCLSYCCCCCPGGCPRSGLGAGRPQLYFVLLLRRLPV